MVFHHLPDLHTAAEFSACRRYRYRLTLTKDPPVNGRTLCVIMQNPSVADEEIADKSIQFLERLIFEKGLPEFQGVSRCIIVNQFAWVQTHSFKGEPSEIGEENDEHLRDAICKAHIVLIAWGKKNPFAERQEVIMEMIRKFGPRTVFMTAKHPSRGYYQEFILPFRI